APHPALIFYHGGGWVIGDLETHDTVCRRQCNAIGGVVIAVDYRLAPEHQYPAAAEDAYAVAKWVSGNAPGIDVDASRIAVGGDSAGGNLTAVVALMARDRGGPALCAQVPIYPVTDYDFSTTSYRDNADGYLLTKDAMVWFWDHYLPMPEAGKEAYASPLRADDLSGLPPALVITAEFDPLRDEGEAYAQRLSEAGVATTLHRYDGMVHGFYQLGAAIPTAHEAAEETAAFLKAAFKL
ncbi:MAG: alpha/beta hydrolase, partial [Dehalococcoidia bacterium]